MVGMVRTGRQGFTLIEVMISLAVLVALTLVFATCVPVAVRASKSNGQYSQALSLCQHKIDQLRAVGYGRLNHTELSDAAIVDDEPTSQPWSFEAVDEVASYLADPSATLTVQEVANNQRKVTATIRWRPATSPGKTSSASLSAIIANVE